MTIHGFVTQGLAHALHKSGDTIASVAPPLGAKCDNHTGVAVGLPAVRMDEGDVVEEGPVFSKARGPGDDGRRSES